MNEPQGSAKKLEPRKEDKPSSHQIQPFIGTTMVPLDGIHSLTFPIFLKKFFFHFFSPVRCFVNLN